MEPTIGTYFYRGSKPNEVKAKEVLEKFTGLFKFVDVEASPNGFTPYILPTFFTFHGNFFSADHAICFLKMPDFRKFLTRDHPELLKLLNELD